jgi:5-methylcytosine-specific restriction protein A
MGKSPPTPHRSLQERDAIAKWYQTALWKRRRLETLTGANWLCQIKATGCTRVANTADHVEPHRGDRAKFERGALQAACPSCHSGHKKAQEMSGRIRGCDVDGIPFDSHWRARKVVDRPRGG